MGVVGYTKKGFTATEHPTTLDIAWAAGIFEGEGSASKRGIVSVAQRGEWLPTKLRALFGGSVYKQKSFHPRTKEQLEDSYIWQISGSRARGFLMTVYKFLSPRRQEQARKALAI